MKVLVLLAFSFLSLFVVQAASLFPGVVFQNKCIEDTGCFYTGPPFYDPIYRPISLTPTSNLNVRFILFTPSNPEEGEDLDATTKSVKESSFDPEFPLKVLIHGYFTDLKENGEFFKIKDALLKSGSCNVIILDWTKNNKPPYPQAVANARAVGAKLSKFLKFVMETTDFKPQNIHVIGHSLGAHVSGYAGEKIPELGRITGLDPAGPYFRHADKTVRLDMTDALFVDIIHTDGSALDLRSLGLNQSIGHMDFYPNGGHRQPGCGNEGKINIILGSLESDSVCSHMRPLDYFLESIDNSNCRFLATQCNSYRNFEKGDCLPENSTVAEMGYHAERIEEVPINSKFFLKTNDKEPFCIRTSA